MSIVSSLCNSSSPITCFSHSRQFYSLEKFQIIEACLISVLTSIISFGLPLLRQCTPCPKPDPELGNECPRPPGTYGNYVNVRINIAHLLLLLPYPCNFHACACDAITILISYHLNQFKEVAIASLI